MASLARLPKLKEGDTGQAVLVLKDALRRTPGLESLADAALAEGERFGHATTALVHRFQELMRGQGVRVDRDAGFQTVVGQNTWGALYGVRLPVGTKHLSKTPDISPDGFNSAAGAAAAAAAVSGGVSSGDLNAAAESARWASAAMPQLDAESRPLAPDGRATLTEDSALSFAALAPEAATLPDLEGVGVPDELAALEDELAALSGLEEGGVDGLSAGGAGAVAALGGAVSMAGLARANHPPSPQLKLFGLQYLMTDRAKQNVLGWKEAMAHRKDVASGFRNFMSAAKASGGTSLANLWDQHIVNSPLGKKVAGNPSLVNALKDIGQGLDKAPAHGGQGGGLFARFQGALQKLESWERTRLPGLYGKYDAVMHAHDAFHARSAPKLSGEWAKLRASSVMTQLEKAGIDPDHALKQLRAGTEAMTGHLKQAGVVDDALDVAKLTGAELKKVLTPEMVRRLATMSAPERMRVLGKEVLSPVGRAVWSAPATQAAVGKTSAAFKEGRAAAMASSKTAASKAAPAPAPATVATSPTSAPAPAPAKPTPEVGSPAKAADAPARAARAATAEKAANAGRSMAQAGLGEAPPAVQALSKGAVGLQVAGGALSAVAAVAGTYDVVVNYDKKSKVDLAFDGLGIAGGTVVAVGTGLVLAGSAPVWVPAALAGGAVAGIVSGAYTLGTLLFPEDAKTVSGVHPAPAE